MRWRGSNCAHNHDLCNGGRLNQWLFKGTGESHMLKKDMSKVQADATAAVER